MLRVVEVGILTMGRSEGDKLRENANMWVRLQVRLFALLETVSDISDGLDKGFTREFDFAAEPADVNIHGPITTKVIVAPDFVQESFAGEDPAPVSGQELKQFIFFKSQFHYFTPDPDLAVCQVHDEITQVQDFILPCVLLQHSFNSENDLPLVKRPEYEIIYAGIIGRLSQMFCVKQGNDRYPGFNSAAVGQIV
jgi:hypothetical protein